MEQVKQILAVLQKQHFWVITGIVVLVVVICWWMATGSLASQFASRKSKLEGDFKNAVVPPNPPNEKVIEAIKKQHLVLKDKVCEAWEILFKEQKEKNPLPAVLGEDFKRYFENLKPKEELPPHYLERYQNFIKNHIPTLLTLVDVRRYASQHNEDGRIRPAGDKNSRNALQNVRRTNVPRGEGPAVPQNEQTEEEMIGTVYWNENDYAAIESRFEWKTRPSTLAVLMAQEDLWVYEALLRVIKNANEGATHLNAAVKQIESLKIGAEASRAWREADSTVFKGIGAPQAGGEMMRAGGMGLSEGMAGRGGTSTTDEFKLFDGRYFDDKDQPLPFDQEYPHAKHPYAEFKMMPIYMSLTMDERKLPNLLVECANSNMPIEVRRIRIVKQEIGPLELSTGQAQGVGGMAGEAGPRPFGGGMSMPTITPRTSGGTRQPGMRPDAKDETNEFDIPVKIYGIIYIFNPPDREKLGTGTAAAEKQGESGTTETPTNQPGKPAPAATKQNKSVMLPIIETRRVALDYPTARFSG